MAKTAIACVDEQKPQKRPAFGEVTQNSNENHKNAATSKFTQELMKIINFHSLQGLLICTCATVKLLSKFLEGKNREKDAFLHTRT